MTSAMAHAGDQARPGFWRAACVAAGTGVAFMIAYHAANAYAAQSGRLHTWVYGFESAIPLVPALIVPYWSIDLLFAITPFLCATRGELRRFAQRVLLAIILATACFIAWPLTITRPPSSEQGLFAGLFEAIHAFDQPHNLFPSLHVAFAFLLRWIWHARSRGIWRLLFHLWFAAITVSTVLVQQHHLIDVLGGGLLAVLVCFVLPIPGDAPLGAAAQGSPMPGSPTQESAVLRAPAQLRDARAWRMGLRFSAGGVLCLAAASAGHRVLSIGLGDLAWLLAWPAWSCALLALAHLRPELGGRLFGKRDGRLPFATRVLLAPYLAVLALSRRWYWRRDRQGVVHVADGVWFGRRPEAAQVRTSGATTLIDLTAEHDAPRLGLPVVGLPWLDLATPSPLALAAAVAAIERHRARGPVLVHCALGYGRSAAAIAAWLVATGRADSERAAIERIGALRRGVMQG